MTAATDPSPLTGAQRKALISQLHDKVARKQETDCDAFADYLDAVADGLQGLKPSDQQKQMQIAMGDLTPVIKMRGVQITATLYTNSSYLGLNSYGTAAVPSRYAPQYQDTDPNGDQTHHFAAFFQLGMQLGSITGGSAGDFFGGLWESMEGTSGNTGDITLAGLAFTAGTNFAKGLLPASELGEAIRDNVCNH